MSFHTSNYISRDHQVNHVGSTCIFPCPLCESSPSSSCGSRSFTSAKMGISPLACWWLDTKSPKCPNSSHSLQVSGTLVVFPDKKYTLWGPELWEQEAVSQWLIEMLSGASSAPSTLFLAPCFLPIRGCQSEVSDLVYILHPEGWHSVLGAYCV